MRSSPRIHPRLAELVRGMDVDRLSIADVWRSASAAAERLELFRPGYHSVLAIVLEERRRRAERRAALADAVEEVWDYTGTDYARLVRRLSDTRRP